MGLSSNFLLTQTNANTCVSRPIFRKKKKKDWLLTLGHYPFSNYTRINFYHGSTHQTRPKALKVLVYRIRSVGLLTVIKGCIALDQWGNWKNCWWACAFRIIFWLFLFVQSNNLLYYSFFKSLKRMWRLNRKSAATWAGQMSFRFAICTRWHYYDTDASRWSLCRWRWVGNQIFREERLFLWELLSAWCLSENCASTGLGSSSQ
jgi:hypothetical protein